jgi:hypothetical protein
MRTPHEAGVAGADVQTLALSGRLRLEVSDPILSRSGLQLQLQLIHPHQSPGVQLCPGLLVQRCGRTTCQSAISAPAGRFLAAAHKSSSSSVEGQSMD